MQMLFVIVLFVGVPIGIGFILEAARRRYEARDKAKMARR